MASKHTNNYSLGMPLLYFYGTTGSSGLTILENAYAGTGTYDKKYYYLGNAADMSLTLGTDSLDHFTVTAGKKQKDKSIIIEQTISLSMTFDEFDADNMRRFFYGANQTKALTDEDSGAAPDGTETHFEFTLGNIPISPTTVTVTATISSSDLDMTDDGGGTLSPASGSSTGTIDYGSGAIVLDYENPPDNGSSILVDYTYIVGITVFDENAITAEGAMLMVFPTTVGRQWKYHIPKCSIKPSGDLGFGADDWMSGTFEIEVLKDETFSHTFDSSAVSCPYGYIDFF